MDICVVLLNITYSGDKCSIYKYFYTKFQFKILSITGDNFCNNSTCVLIVGYCRGGTTMTLDVLSKTDDSLALFEPISDLTLSSNLKVPVPFYNGTVR